MTGEHVRGEGRDRGLFSRFGYEVPAEFRKDYLAAPGAGGAYSGSTFTPALIPSWNRAPSGVWIPEGANRHTPTDGILTYISAEEALGESMPHARIEAELRMLPLGLTLVLVAEALNDLHTMSREDVDRKYADEWFEGKLLERVKNLLRDPTRGLVAPQVLLVLLKKALLYSPDTLPPDTPRGKPILALLTVAQHLGSHVDGAAAVLDDTPGPLGRELIANQHFHAPRSAAHVIARFVRRWHQLPVEMAGHKDVYDLAGAYEAATGVPLADLSSVAAALWASANHNRIIVAPDHFAGTHLTPDRVERVLDLIATDIPNLRASVQGEAKPTEWSFDMFSRSPVIRLPNGGLLVLDQDLLVQRAFGWWPMLDVKKPPNGRPTDKARADAAEGCLRHLTEVYVKEVLAAIAGTGTARRIYGDAELRAAFPGPGQKITDVAIDYGDAWVLAEVCTVRLRSDSAHAVSEDAQVADLDKLVAKARQLDATVKALKNNETQLTGAKVSQGKVFYPLLVMAEGFPVNPITLTVLRERVKRAGLLNGSRIMPLEVADTEEIELVEALQESGLAGLRDVLEGKRTADLQRESLRNYIIRERRWQPRRTRRVDALWVRTLDAYRTEPDRADDAGATSTPPTTPG